MPRSKRLVVDASVARSAAVGPIADACPELCRATLSAIQECHQVVFSREGWQEWDRHESRFAQQWRRRMVASRKIVFLSDLEDGEFREALSRTAGSQAVRSALAKDAHLIEAANAADRIAISRDEEIRGCFRSACTAVALLRAILWANPEIENEGVVAWLRAGARSERARRLDASRS